MIGHGCILPFIDSIIVGGERMMEVVVTVDATEKVGRYALLDSFLLVLLRFSAFHRNGLNDFEWTSVAEELHRKRKKVYLLMDRVFFDADFPLMEQWILQAENLSVDGYFVSDPGMIAFLQKRGLASKTIYYSQTQIQSLMEATAFLNRGIFRVFLSGEAIDSPIREVPRGLGIRLFCYPNLFYSRRKLLNSGGNPEEDSDIFQIRECNRTMKLRIFQNEYGTYIFSDRPENRLAWLSEPESRIDMGLIDDQFVDSDTLDRILRFCKEARER